jgi:hypothetical protein
MPPAFRQEILLNQALAPVRMRLGRQKLPGKKGCACSCCAFSGASSRPSFCRANGQAPAGFLFLPMIQSFDGTISAG